MGTATASVTTRVSPEVPRNSGPAALCEASSPPREIFEHASRPSLDDLHVLTRGKHITDPGRCLVPAPLQEPPLPVRDLRASLLVMSSARSSFPDISHCIELSFPVSSASPIACPRLHQGHAARARRASRSHRHESRLRGGAKHDGDECGFAGAAVQCKPKGTSCRRWDQLHAKADETQVRVSKVHAQYGRQVALLSRPSERFQGRVFIGRSETGAEPSGGPPARQRGTRRARLAGPDERAELEDAQLAHEQVEHSATQLKSEHSPVQMQLDEKDTEERLAKGPENKLRDQVAVPKARVGRLQAGAQTTAMATASGSSLPHPDSRTSTAYPAHAVK